MEKSKCEESHPVENMSESDASLENKKFKGKLHGGGNAVIQNK